VPKSPYYVAVIGDIVASREIKNRAAVQRRYEKLMEQLNMDLRADLRSQFTITLGDEFQGLLAKAHSIADLIWTVDAFAAVPVRLGFGYGPLSTSLKRVALQMDGPAFYNARDAIEHARQKRVLGGVFRGFGEDEDAVLNGFARLLQHQRERMTARRKELVTLLRAGYTQSEVTQKLRISPPAVSKAVKVAGWDAYAEGERGFRVALDRSSRREGAP
jgi:SatD family (SatD)